MYKILVIVRNLTTIIEGLCPCINSNSCSTDRNQVVKWQLPSVNVNEILYTEGLFHNLQVTTTHGINSKMEHYLLPSKLTGT